MRRPAAKPLPLSDTMLPTQSTCCWARRSCRVTKQAGLAFSFCILLTGAGAVPIRQEPGHPVPPELQPYVNAQSVVNWPPAKLIKQYSELEDLEFARSQEELPALLEKVGEGVEALFRDFANVSSIESISQEMQNPRAAPQALDPVGQEIGIRRGMPQALQRTCNYLIVAHRDEKGIFLEEYRTNNKGERIDLGSFLIVTQGFVSTPLLFHPRYQTGSLYRYLGRETKGRKLQVLAFAQRPETAELIGSFHLIGGPVALLTQGIAWIDPDCFQIVRMHTDLLAPRTDIRLARQASEIELGEVRFEGLPQPLWLPSKVVVTIDWQHTTYRNRHHYKNYKLFSVETREDKKEIVRPPRHIP